MYITLGILLFSIVFFVSGKLRSDLVALCSLILLLIFGILTPEEGLSGFSNTIVVMMIGLFVVSGAIFQTGLAKMISSKILRLAGDSEIRLFLLVMLATSAIGAFISNTGTVALMLPILVSLASTSGMNVSRLLMPMAFASSMGGMFTLIGTPPNLVIDSVLRDNGQQGLSFFSFTPVGIICFTVGLLILIPLSRAFLTGKDGKKEKGQKKNKSLNELAREYQLATDLYRVKVKKDSRLVGKTIAELNVFRKYRLNVLEVRRESGGRSSFLKSVSQKLATHTELEANDLIYLMGDFEQVERFDQDYDLDIVDTHTPEVVSDPEPGQPARNALDFYDIGIAEIVLMPTSTLKNQTIIGINFRQRYHLNVLGIRRKSEYILHDMKDVKLETGDVLLVQGHWKEIGLLSEEQNDWVVLGRPLEEATKVTLDYKAPVAASILVLMVAAMVFDFIPIAPVTAVMIAAVLMILTGCLKNVEAAYRTINWESIVLIAAMLPLSLALEKTGTSEIISNSLVGGLGQYGPVVLLGGIYFTTSLMTMFISNTATAVLLAPIAYQAALGIGVSPYPFLFAVSVAASMCFASPFSTPPNALVMPAGPYTFMDYVKVGLPLQIILGIIMIFTLPLLFPF